MGGGALVGGGLRADAGLAGKTCKSRLLSHSMSIPPLSVGVSFVLVCRTAWSQRDKGDILDETLSALSPSILGFSDVDPPVA